MFQPKIRLLVALTFAALMSAGCGPVIDSNAWFVSQYKKSAEFLFEPETKPRQVDERPDVRRLIRDNISSVFGRTNVKNVRVGSARPNGYGWAACIQADVVGIVNRDTGTHYFVVEFDNGKVGLRRPATEIDKCEKEPFEPI